MSDPCSVLTNISFLSSLTKFGVVPPHVILHMFKVCLDDFSGTNVENIALLLEGCGRFLLRSEETQQPFSKMVRGTCLWNDSTCSTSQQDITGGVDATEAKYASSGSEATFTARESRAFLLISHSVLYITSRVLPSNKSVLYANSLVRCL